MRLLTCELNAVMGVATPTGTARTPIGMDLVVVVVLPLSTAIRTLQWSVSATPVSAPAPVPVPSSVFVVGSPEKGFTSPKKSPPTNRGGWATAGRATAATNNRG